MKVDRLVSIIMLLLEKDRVGAQELAQLFEVSPRTIYRDIDAINLAGIPVRPTAGVGGGFEIMPSYKLDKSVFSTADLSAILMGLSISPTSCAERNWSMLWQRSSASPPPSGLKMLNEKQIRFALICARGWATPQSHRIWS